ncbi:MAG: extracellular solute-binding protein [Ilumatobacteraceae bacterium]
MDHLSIWNTLFSDAARAQLEELAAEYTAATGIAVTVEARGSAARMLDDLGALDVADWPDVILGPDVMTRPLHDSGHFVAPGECGTFGREAALLPAVRAHYTIDGRLAAVPFGVSTLLLMFDRVEYARAGLDPTEPLATFGDLLAAAEQIRVSGASPHGLVLDDHCVEWAVSAYASMRGETLSPPLDGHDSSPVQPDYATPENVATLTDLQAAAKAGDIVYVGNNSTTFADLSRIVDPADGGTMALHTSAALGDLINLFEAGNFPDAQLGVLPMPGPGAGAVAGGNALFLTDRDDATHNGAAWDLIEWLSAPAQLARFDVATGYLPPDTETAADAALLAAWAEHPELRVGYDQLAAAPDGPAAGGLLLGPADLVNAAGYSACTRLLGDGRDASEVLTDFQAVVDGLVAAYEARP